MRQTDKLSDHIIDDSGHNFDEAVINIINDIAHERVETSRPAKTSRSEDMKNEETEEQIDSFFDLADDV